MDSIYAGFISGIVQTIIGHPLDTLKTWSQNSIRLKKPPINIVNLYKGIAYPMLQNPLLISTSFFSNHYLKEKQIMFIFLVQSQELFQELFQHRLINIK
jgi:hypothetical protein